MPDKLFIYTDGGSRGNPGPSAVGIYIEDENGKTIQKIAKKIGEATNNIAEYMAIIEALEWFKTSNFKAAISGLYFFLDSRLVVNQVNGLFKVKNGNLRNFILKIRELEQELKIKVDYELIPREKNWRADKLVNQALDL